jgi:hypothetical protein
MSLRAVRSTTPIGTVPCPPARAPSERGQHNGCQNERCDAPSEALCGLLSGTFEGPEIVSDFLYVLIDVHGSEVFHRTTSEPRCRSGRFDCARRTGAGSGILDLFGGTPIVMREVVG